MASVDLRERLATLQHSINLQVLNPQTHTLATPAFADTVHAVAEIVQEKLFHRVLHISLEEYFKQTLDISRAQVYRIVDASLVLRDLEPLALPLPTKQRVCSAIKSLAPTRELRQRLWQQALADYGPHHITSKEIQRVWERLQTGLAASTLASEQTMSVSTAPVTTLAPVIALSSSMCPPNTHPDIISETIHALQALLDSGIHLEPLVGGQWVSGVTRWRFFRENENDGGSNSIESCTMAVNPDMSTYPISSSNDPSSVVVNGVNSTAEYIVGSQQPQRLLLPYALLPPQQLQHQLIKDNEFNYHSNTLPHSVQSHNPGYTINNMNMQSTPLYTGFPTITTPTVPSPPLSTYHTPLVPSFTSQPSLDLHQSAHPMALHTLSHAVSQLQQLTSSLLASSSTSSTTNANIHTPFPVHSNLSPQQEPLLSPSHSHSSSSSLSSIISLPLFNSVTDIPPSSTVLHSYGTLTTIASIPSISTLDHDHTLLTSSTKRQRTSTSSATSITEKKPRISRKKLTKPVSTMVGILPSPETAVKETN